MEETKLISCVLAPRADNHVAGEDRSFFAITPLVHEIQRLRLPAHKSHWQKVHTSNHLNRETMFFKMSSEHRRIVQSYMMNNYSVLKTYRVFAQRGGHAIPERIDIWRF